MARLSVPGSDENSWGSLLNEFLRVAHHEFGTLKGSYVNATQYGSLKESIEAIGPDEKTLLISAPIGLGPSDLTVPDNITLQFLRGGSLVVNNGETLTVHGPIVAGLWQIFDIKKPDKATPKNYYENAGNVFFGSSARESYPHWFGAKGDGQEDDAFALTKAFAALTEGGVVTFPGGYTFKISHGIDVKYDNITIIGYGATIFMDGQSTRIVEIETITYTQDASLLVWNRGNASGANKGRFIVVDHEIVLQNPITNFKCLGLTFKNTGSVSSPYRDRAIALFLAVVENFEVKDCTFLNGYCEQIEAVVAKGIIAHNVWQNCNHNAISGGFDEVLITGNVMIDVRQGFEAGGRVKMTNNILRLTNPEHYAAGTGIWVSSGGGNKVRVNCEITNNKIYGYYFNSIQITDSGDIPDQFRTIVIKDNVIRPSVDVGAGGVTGIYIHPTNGTYIIEGNIFDDTDCSADYGTMITLVNDGTRGGKYIIKNNTGRFTTQHAYSMIQTPPDLKVAITNNDAFLIGDAAFRNNDVEGCYKNMIRLGKWDLTQQTLSNNRLNGETQYIDKTANSVIALADHSALYFDTAAKNVTKIQASGSFTVVNLHPSDSITLVSGPNIQTLNGLNLVLAPSQTAGFIVVNKEGDVIKQLF